jgi:tetratricopeptide (TPR) repeat protein
MFKFIVKSVMARIDAQAAAIFGLAIACSLTSHQAQTPPPTGPQQAWQEASSYLFNESNRLFNEEAEKKGPNLREASFGQAVTLVSIQPKTTANVEKAASLCEQIIAQNPNDDLGLNAKFFLIRIEQFHRQPANPTRAEQLIRELLRDHPTHVTSQLAASRLIFLRLYQPIPKKERLHRLPELIALLPKITELKARQNYQMVLGNACLQYDLDDEQALASLIEAEAMFIPTMQVRANTVMQIGHLAQRLGRHDVAIKYYQKFTEEFPRDNRFYLVQERLTGLKGKKG